MFVDSGAGAPRDIHSLGSVIAWLETKNPEETYNYYHCHECLLSQYYRAMGLDFVEVGSVDMRHREKNGYFINKLLPEGWNMAAHGRTMPLEKYWNRAKWTFGAALKRFRKLQKEQLRAEFVALMAAA